MVGIAAETTRVGLKQMQEAIDGGADTVLVLTPTTLSRGRDAAMLNYYRTLADKDSSGDVVRLQTIIDATPPEFILYSGSSRALTAAVAIGCHGAITGSGNYVPELVLETMRAAREGPVKARRLQKRLSAISADVEAHGLPGVKAAAKAAGLDPGHPREPLTRLSRGAETSIAKLI
jgi:4-hydroxy-tetrahydrodipicolinate synthase